MTAREEIQSIHWASWTSVLGPEVHGIWPKYTQVNDINATDASFEHQSIVTGDDFGLVKLFRFPCIKKGVCVCVCVCEGERENHTSLGRLFAITDIALFVCLYHIQVLNSGSMWAIRLM